MQVKWFAGLACSLGAALLALPHLSAQDKAEGPKPLVRDIEGAGPQQPGKYWIGIEPRPLGEALRAQLKLQNGQGVLVEEILPDAPAAKAGVQRFDVLLSVNDKSLTDTKTLVEAVNTSEGKPLTLKLLRGGQEMSVQVTPAERAAPAVPATPLSPAMTPQDAFRQWAISESRDPLRMRFFHPGVVLGQASELPANVSVTIVRQGKEPAKISVKQGDKSWEITDKELDKLPEDVRKFVAPMLAPQPFNIKLDGPGGLPNVGTDFLIRDFGPAGTKELEQRVEKRMEDMRQKLEEMRKSIEELQQRQKPADGA